MTNSVAIFLVLMIVAVLALDHYWLQLDLLVVTGKQLNRLIDFLIFWS